MARELSDQQELRRIWNQSSIPVVLRRTGKGERLRIRLPFHQGNGQWICNGRRTKPTWSKVGKYWEAPRSWFNDLVDRALDRFGSIYIVQPYREQEKCAPACLNASGHECECSCMGQNHGAGNNGSWFEVSETFATRWHDREIACRLLKRTGAK